MYNGTARRVAIIGGMRTPFCRAQSGFADLSNQDMMTAALTGLVERFALKGEKLDDATMGAVIRHTRDWNLARECILGSGLAPETPGFDLTRACGTSLEAVILMGHKIALGQIEAGIGGGTDSISDAPVVYPDSYRRLLMQSYRGRTFWQKFRPWLGLRPHHFKPEFPGVVEPRTGLSMGESCELMAQKWQISRADQDALALRSHQRAAEAWESGFYSDLVVPLAGIRQDNNIRADTSLQKMATLKPVFDRSGKGTLTAANSTPLTDGAAAVLLSSEQWARERGLPVQAYLSFAQVAAVDFVAGEGLLMAPAFAVSRMLQQAGLELQDFDFYEIHEAFAAQVLCTLRAWESAEFCRERLGRAAPLGSIDRDKLNTMGGSVAVGHPFAATGARIVGTLASLLARKGSGRGLISVCTGGGMGVTAILEAA